MDEMGSLPTCPFCGQKVDEGPSMHVWAPSCCGDHGSHVIVYYFHVSETEHEGLVATVKHLLGEEVMDWMRARHVVEILQERGDLVEVGEWVFLRRPVPPTISEIILGEATVTWTSGDIGLPRL